jgi:hypothetical protein
MKVDKNAQLVAQFVSKIQNLTRIAELADAFVDIAESGAWRDYTFATGHFRFRLSEFDYFLIATGVKRDDAARVLAYNKRSKELVPFMDPHADKRRRRPLEQAAKEYQAADSLNTDLAAKAVELGWTGESGQLTVQKSPVGRRALDNRTRREQCWRASWSDERTPAQAITDKLLANPELAREVYKRLDSARNSREYDKRKRRSA